MRPEKRTWVAFLAGAGLATAGLTAGTSFASSPPAAPPSAPPSAERTVPVSAAAAPLVTKACANKKTGAISIVGTAHKKCTSLEKAVTFAKPVPGPAGPQGPQGAAGAQGAQGPVGPVGPSGSSLLQPDGSLVLDGSLRIVSKNGAYVLVLNDEGIGLKGPGGSMVIDPFALSTQSSAKAPS